MTATVTALASAAATTQSASAAPTTQSAARRTHTLPTPAQLRERLPLSSAEAAAIEAHRQAIRDILAGKDNRLLVITGPCSLHDPDAAIEYAERLAELQSRVADRLLLVMRAYVEKPRTTVGWKGMLYDPQLDGSGDMAGGLALSRRTMLAISELGLPIATELLQPLAASYLDDLLSWGCIGARTSESQIHREMVSGLHLPVGFKNGTDGSMTVACDAMRSARHPHQHFGMDLHGRPALVETAGNPDTHIVLRGGHSGPNYQADAVAKVRAELERLGMPAALVVDCSHANSGKDPLRQPQVMADVIAQRAAGDASLRGVMLESHLFDGCQALSGELRYGISITDGCLGWEATEQSLLAAAEQLRG